MTHTRILIVEHEDKVRDLLTRFLSSKGYEVIVAPDGEAGLEAFAELPPDLVLSSVALPGLTGFEVCRAIRRLDVAVPIVLMGTARHAKTLAEGVRDTLGVAHCLVRPFSATELLDAIQDALVTAGEFGAFGGPAFAEDPVRTAEIEPVEVEAVWASAETPPPATHHSRPLPPLPLGRGGRAATIEEDADSDSDRGLLVATPVPAEPAPAEPAPAEPAPAAPAPAEPAPAPAQVAPVSAPPAPAASVEALPEEEIGYALRPMMPASPNDPRGIYGESTLPQVLYSCFRDLFSGRLVLRRGPVVKMISIVGGRPVNAESNAPGDGLGYRLMAVGAITAAQHEQALAALPRGGLRLGEVLVQAGFIEPAALTEHLRRQVRERLLDCFAWTGAEYGLVYDPLIGEQVDVFEVNPLVLVFEGIKTRFPVAPLLHHFDRCGRRPVSRTTKLTDYGTMLKDFADDLRVAELCDGERTLGEVLSCSPFGMVDTLRILRALEITSCVTFGAPRAAAVAPAGDARRTQPAFRPRVSTGVHRTSPAASTESAPPPGRTTGSHRVSPSSEPPRPQRAAHHSGPRRVPTGLNRVPTRSGDGQRPLPNRGLSTPPRAEDAVRGLVDEKFAALSGADHYALLDLTPGATSDQVRAAHARLLRVLHPDQVAGLGDPRLTERARKVTERLTEAHDVLTDRQRRGKYDAVHVRAPAEVASGPDIVRAEQNFESGRNCLANQEPARAAEFFEAACKQDPHAAHYRVYLGWARFTAAAAQDRKARGDAIEEMKRGASDEAARDDCHVLLGHALRAHGVKDGAARAYQRAIQLNRGNQEALRALRELEAATEGKDEKAGLFGKLFSRRS